MSEKQSYNDQKTNRRLFPPTKKQEPMLRFELIKRNEKRLLKMQPRDQLENSKKMSGLLIKNKIYEIPLKISVKKNKQTKSSKH